MAKRKQKPESAAGTPLLGCKPDENPQTTWIKPDQLSGQTDLFDVPKVQTNHDLLQQNLDSEQ